MDVQLQKGFYRHFKHDPKGDPGNYYYEVLNVAHNKDLNLSVVCYRPLYKSYVYELGRQWDFKPVADWFKPLPDGNTRYTLIIDRDEIKQLEQLKQNLYTTEPHVLTITLPAA